jgi:hypothetical protein
VDDALALILALKSDELDVMAITTVSGNVHVDKVNRNVSRILEVLPYEENLILARGEDRPLKRKRKEAESVHGDDGLGDIQDYGSSKTLPLDDRPAWKVICDLASEYPQEIILITLGLLTNLAMAVEKDPDSIHHLHEVVSMGGVFFDVGNVGPDAEFNVMADPDAARKVVRFCRDSCLKIPVDQAGRPVDLPENPSQHDFERVKDTGDHCGKQQHRNDQPSDHPPGTGHISFAAGIHQAFEPGIRAFCRHLGHGFFRGSRCVQILLMHDLVHVFHHHNGIVHHIPRPTSDPGQCP